MQVPGLRTVNTHLRAASRLNPVRPALWLGLRVAAATALPLALAPFLGPVAGTWAPLAGYAIALVDKGGAYRSRARTMAGATVGALLAILLGSVVSGTSVPKVAAITLGITLCALAPVWGTLGTAVGSPVGVQLLVAASIVARPGEIPLRLAGFALGALWAMFLGLVVWPVRVYRPGRRAVSALLLALSDHAGLLARHGQGDPRWREGLTRHQRVLRERLEVARDTLASTRRGRRGDTGRGERLLAVVQTGEQMTGTLVGIEEVLDAGCPPATEQIVLRGLRNCATALAELATRVTDESRLPPMRTPAWDATLAREGLAGQSGAVLAFSQHVLRLLARVQEDRERSSDHIDSLFDDDQPLRVRIVEPDRSGQGLARLWTVFNPQSAVLRHALRVGTVVLTASLILTRFELPYGYWVTMTAFILLQPYRVRTTTRALQRTVGTVLGAMAASLIARFVIDPSLMLIVIVVFAGASASVLQINYALYSLFVTPTFMLLLELHVPDTSLFGVRMLNTALGGALALLGGLLLWPGKEQERFGTQLAAALESAAHYVGEVMRAIHEERTPPVPEIQAARRRFDLALNNVELVLERVFAENLPRAVIEPRMTLVTFTRRLGTAINVFGTTRTVVAYTPHLPAIAAFAHSVEARLRRLAEAIRAGAVPDLPPRANVEIGDPVITARLERIEYQLSVLAEAAGRAARQEAQRLRPADDPATGALRS